MSIEFGELLNYEAEQAVLGAILYRNDSWDQVADILKPEAFAEPVFGRIYGVASQMIAAGHQANAVTLKSFFERDESLADVGGTRFLADLQGSYIGLINLADYAKVINDYWMRRQAAEQITLLATQIQDQEDEQSARQILESHTAQIDLITGHDKSQRGLSLVGEDLGLVEANLAEAMTRYKGGKVAGLSTGFRNLDRALCGGLRPGKLYVLGSGTSMGKTALSNAIAMNVADQGTPVGLYSVEMLSNEVLLRMACSKALVDLTAAQQGSITPQEHQRLRQWLAWLASNPIFVDESMSNTPDAIRLGARRLQRRCKLGLIIVDYLQLLRDPTSRASKSNRVAEVTEITRSLKMTAVLLGVPVLCLSQLSREYAKRDNQRPQLSDLRDSGSIEQDADVVMFLHRQAYFLERDGKAPKQPEMEWRADLEACRNKAEVIVAKQRSGPLGTVNLFFESAYTAFSEHPQGQEEIAF